MTTQRTEETTETPQSTTSTRKLRRRQLSSMQVMFAIILTIGLMLTIQFSTRIEAERDLITIRETINEEIDLLRREQVSLNNQLAFVGSDAYVATWAHSEGRMVRDGEVLVIPVPSSTTLLQVPPVVGVQSSVVVDTTLPEPAKWELWWSLFFDDLPPKIGS